MLHQNNIVPPFKQNPLPDLRNVLQHQHAPSQIIMPNFSPSPNFNPSSNPKPLSTSQSKPQSKSNYPSRLRIHSLPQPPNQNPISPSSSKLLNLEKLKSRPNQLKQSNGIMNQPPDYISHKYTFKNAPDTPRIKQDGLCLFGSCCSIIKQTQRQVYLSPTQLISIGYFYKNPKPEPKSLKIHKNTTSLNSVQKSFFKDTSNVIE